MKTVLYLGCHCDDIELGCGGTIHKHRGRSRQICHVFSNTNPQSIQLEAISRKALSLLGTDEISFSSFKVRAFTSERQPIWAQCQLLQNAYDPDIVYVNSDDGHQDHRCLYEEACRKTFKKSILTYSLPTLVRQDYFEELNADHIDLKLKALKLYTIYRDKPYFNEDLIVSVMRVEGSKVGVSFAESYKVIRMINGLF